MSNSQPRPKPKNALQSSLQIFEDPRYKEYEQIPIEKFKIDKERTQKEFNQLQNDLVNLKEEYIKTKQRALDRENELRNHINNLLIKYRARDPKENLENINELKDQILDNIKTLEAQSKEDIKAKKADMETRIKLRLVDSEINYNRELEKKVRDQQEILRILHEFTQDMKKIKSNYKSIKEKVDQYVQENTLYRTEIKELEFKNDDLKTEIMRLKHLNNKLSIKIMGKKDSEKEEEEIPPVNASMKVKFENMEKAKFRSQIKEKYANKETTNTNNNSNISIDKIIELLSNESFVNKHYRECSVISSLLNIYEKTSQKIRHLNSEYQALCDHHPIYDRLLEIIRVLKGKEVTNKLKSIGNVSKRIMNELLGNYTITMKKEQRKELIDYIIKDQEINRLIFDSKLPNVMNRERQIGN